MIVETVSFSRHDIIQYGIEDNQEFFIKINLLFPVDRMGINRAVFADDGSRGGYIRSLTNECSCNRSWMFFRDERR